MKHNCIHITDQLGLHQVTCHVTSRGSKPLIEIKFFIFAMAIVITVTVIIRLSLTCSQSYCEIFNEKISQALCIHHEELQSTIIKSVLSPQIIEIVTARRFAWNELSRNQGRRRYRMSRHFTVASPNFDPKQWVLL